MRRVLLDSCVWLWWMADHPTLGNNARTIIMDERNIMFVSAATVWEVGIKRSKGGLHLDGNLQALVEDKGFVPLRL